jgi:hypothetical protein
LFVGLVSFCLVIYQAIQAKPSESVYEWIVVFDYVGYVLFFNALFFVIHAIAIIIWSVEASHQYNIFHSASMADILQSIEGIKKSSLSRFFYESNYNPILLKPRQMAEFKVIHVLFRDVFGIPDNFEFGEYLGKCFERYSLNIIHLSVSSWMIMLFLHGLNLIRVYTPSIHRSFDCEEGQKGCLKSYVALFCIFELLLFCYVLLVLFIGRVYTLRLLRKLNVEGIRGADDDLAFFLTVKATQELENKTPSKKAESDDIILLHRGNPQIRVHRMSMTSFSRKIGQ